MNRSRLLLLSLLAAVFGALFAAPLAGADLLTPENGGSSNADDIDALYKYVLVVAALVFVGVEGVLFYSLWKFRARKGAVAAQIRGNTRLEIGWTAGAAVILVVLAVLTFVKLDGIRNPPDSDANIPDGILTAQVDRKLPPSGKSLNVCVNGQQYNWRFTYAADCDNAPLDAVFTYGEMVVPVGTTVTLDITAQDVAHSWWIPALGGKFDAVPGYTNFTWFKASRAATFRGQCAELCGRNHANMVASVRAVPVSDYEAWVDGQRRAIQAANDGAERQRQQIEEDN